MNKGKIPSVSKQKQQDEIRKAKIKGSRGIQELKRTQEFFQRREIKASLAKAI